MLIRETLYLIFCAFAGGAISAGYVAFITLLGVFEKLSEKYKANKYAKTIEILIIAGVSIGNLFHLLGYPIPIGRPGIVIFTLFGGFFTGCLAGALAETLDVFPILSRRLAIRDFLPYVLIAAAIGKLIGSIIGLYFFQNM